MNETVTFIGTFRISDYPAWLQAIDRMADFVAAHVPGVLSFDAYATADGSEGTVLYVHPNAESFDQHLSAAATLIREGSEMVEVTSVQLLGSPHSETVDLLRAAGVPVSVRGLVTGFTPSDRREDPPSARPG